MNAFATVADRSAVRDEKSTPKRSRPRPQRVWQTVGPPVIFVVMFAVVAALTPAFLGGGGLTIIAASAAPILLVALGQALVLHIGSIDLSNAAIALLGAILLATFLAPLGAVAPLVVLAIVTLCGALNGLLVAFAQVPSFALTLGTLGIYSAAALVTSGATTVYVTANGEGVAALYQTGVVGIPLTFWLGVVVAVILWAVLRFTRLGLGMTAVGRNESGAIFSAVRTRAIKVVAFSLSGFTAGLASIAIIAQAGSASPTGLGSDLLLPAIAAAIVGGTSISGGATNPINVVFGALTVALVPIATAALGIDAQAQSLVYGVVIITVVALTMTRSRGSIVK
ncbi:ABC transporter permease [Microbacterium sp. Bi128]|uniref:ABC transporter permease n=1 Tax=Microbacterium sp. Bi128 TaxID=2821115 RepID=UPI001DD1AE9F|nr:ABC transporter permease [Microbacterium sp. Bi128]CAH0158672.1 D-allose transport system permease protein AlsC [Microbacterium sp. Bi128]